MDRKLSHVEKVVAVNPIENADNIVCVQTLGWFCVAKKIDNIKVGDYVNYIEIDSITPMTPFFTFMAERKYRVRTIKLRKQISQGLVISYDNFLQILKELGKEKEKYKWEEGFDTTELLNITKYESPSDKEQNFTPKKNHNPIIKFLTRFSWYRKLFKTKSKSFPNWISKTDEERIQNIPQILLNTDNDWYVTEKLDGQSATYWYIHKFIPEFGICSRTVRKFEFDNSNWSKVAKQFNIKKILKNQKLDIAIQGEILAPKIQGGKYHNNEKHIDSLQFPFDFYIFNIYDIKNKRYFSLKQMQEFSKQTGLKLVPILETNRSLINNLQEIINYSDGKSTLADTLREGLVWRKQDQSISFKVISNKFLLKE